VERHRLLLEESARREKVEGIDVVREDHRPGSETTIEGVELEAATKSVPVMVGGFPVGVRVVHDEDMGAAPQGDVSPESRYFPINESHLVPRKVGHFVGADRNDLVVGEAGDAEVGDPSRGSLERGPSTGRMDKGFKEGGRELARTHFGDRSRGTSDDRRQHGEMRGIGGVRTGESFDHASPNARRRT
jgi:hypothetical protein